uniref:Transmembrane protein n=1 Tax=Rhizophora mucronata TaxID=61149 RepID=A0A2P2PQ07_RHIMU
MEMTNNSIMEKQKLGVLDILEEALVISTNSISFLIFILFMSLPLFLFSISYEIFFQRVLAEAIRILTPPAGYSNFWWPAPGFIFSQVDKGFLYKLLHLFLLYLIPFHLLELFTAVITVDLASKSYAGDKPMTLKDMVPRSIHYNKLRAPFITSVYVLALSICTLPGFLWLVMNYYASFFNEVYAVPLTIFYGVASVLLLGKYMEWSAVWNVGIVLSIVEENVYGVQAIVLSEFLSRDRKQQGGRLMLVFFAWELFGRLPCFLASCNEIGNAIIVQVSLFCLGNVIKWVTCLVYFYDCKRQKMEKKFDEEDGREIKAGDK